MGPTCDQDSDLQDSENAVTRLLITVITDDIKFILAETKTM